jgi:hypothetical protein
MCGEHFGVPRPLFPGPLPLFRNEKEMKKPFLKVKRNEKVLHNNMLNSGIPFKTS